MVLAEPIDDVAFKFLTEFDQFGGLFGAGAACHVVFDGVALDAAAFEIVGIGFLAIAEN